MDVLVKVCPLSSMKKVPSCSDDTFGMLILPVRAVVAYVARVVSLPPTDLLRRAYGNVRTARAMHR